MKDEKSVRVPRPGYQYQYQLPNTNINTEGSGSTRKLSMEKKYRSKRKPALEPIFICARAATMIPNMASLLPNTKISRVSALSAISVPMAHSHVPATWKP
jgi:hypothetical protein